MEGEEIKGINTHIVDEGDMDESDCDVDDDEEEEEDSEDEDEDEEGLYGEEEDETLIGDVESNVMQHH